MFDLDEIERALAADAYRSGDMIIREALTDLAALVAEVKRLRERNAELENLIEHYRQTADA